MKHLMSGNEATARGVYEAGIKICSAYPGAPRREIVESLGRERRGGCWAGGPRGTVGVEVA